jgi:hypothetical protein
MLFSEILRESYIVHYFPWLKWLSCMMMTTYRSSRVTTLYVFDSAIWLSVMMILLLLSPIVLIDLVDSLDFANIFLMTLEGELGFQP